MNLKTTLFFLCTVTSLIIATSWPANCDRGMYLGVCQELVNTARSHEARSTFHQNVARNLQMQIENMSKLPKNQGTIAAMENLFTQYDQNRALERRFRTLFRQATDEAERCMSSAE
jgi:hypothetical protein